MSKASWLIAWNREKRGFIARKHSGPPPESLDGDAVSLEEALRGVDGHSTVLVDDRIICDCVVDAPEGQKAATATEFSRLRMALAGRESIAALRNVPATHWPLAPRDQAGLFSKIEYGNARTSEIRIEPMGGAPSTIGREELDPERRLDPWYYQPRFVELRRKLRGSGAPYVGSACQVLCSKRDGLEPGHEGSDRDPWWINTPQMAQQLKEINRKRILEHARPRPEDVRLIDGDVLLALAGRHGLKVAQYRRELGPAVTSRYIRVFRATGDTDSGKLFERVASEDFLGQIEMHLSDRLYIPIPEPATLASHLLPVTPVEASWVRAVSKLAAAVPVRPGVAFGEILDADLPAERPVRRALMAAANRLDERWLVLGAVREAVERVHRYAERKQSKVGRVLLGPEGLSEADLDQVLRCKRALLTVDSLSPLRPSVEYPTYQKVIEIVGGDHLFVIVRRAGSDRRHPGRALVEHVFADSAEEIQTVEFEMRAEPAGDSVIDPRDHWRIEPTANARCALAASMLAEFCRAHMMGPQLFRSRGNALSAHVRALDALTQNLYVAGASGHVVAAKAAPATIRRRRKLYDFPPGSKEFRTYDSALAERIHDFAHLLKGDERAILVEGETGTGKTALAGILCEMANLPRPFVIGAELPMGEDAVPRLFGWVKGAYPGLQGANPGFVGDAQDRQIPIFIDEINSRSLELQLRLMRLIDDRAYRRVGATGADDTFDYACLAATNEPLSDLVRKKKFREDLRMRLGPPLVIPPLRDRPADLEELIRHFADKPSTQGGTAVNLDPSAWDLLMAHRWPGNVRELEIVMGRISRLARQGERVTSAFISDRFPDLTAEPRVGEEVSEEYQHLKHLESLLGKGMMVGDAFREHMNSRGKPVKHDNLPKYIGTQARRRLIEAHREEFKQLYDKLRPRKKRVR